MRQIHFYYISCTVLLTLQMRAQNTYLLALDGDIDFQPEAITRLVDKMKKNQNLGAACGRILPTGSGFMVLIFDCLPIMFTLI